MWGIPGPDAELCPHLMHKGSSVKRSRLGTLRGALSSVAVLSLATTCLALTVAPATAAEVPGDDLPASNLPDHRFSANVSSLAADVYLFDYANNAFNHVASGLDARADTSSMFDSFVPNGTEIWFGSHDANARSGFLGFPEGEALPDDAAAEALGYLGTDQETAAPGGTSAPAGLGSLGAGTALAQTPSPGVRAADFGSVDKPLGVARATSQGFDLGELKVGSSLLDPITSVHEEVIARAETTWVPIEGSERRGVRAYGETAGGAYRLLNDSVLVEVMEPGSVELVMDGGAGRTKATAPTLRITGPDKTEHITRPGDGRRTFTFVDPGDPTLELQITTGNTYTSGRGGVSGGGQVYGVQGNFHRVLEGGSRANLGHLRLAEVVAYVTVPEGGVDASPISDIDADGLDDFFESQRGYDMRDADMDDDGLLDGEEVKANSDPREEDSDGDGLLDGAEVNEHGTSPTSRDTDGDGLDDKAELEIHKTKPTVWDTDEDGLSDGSEVGYDEFEGIGTDPLKADTDGDTLLDGIEVNSGKSDPLLLDTDGGTADDGVETALGTNPRNPEDDYTIQDRDQDGLTGAEEFTAGTDPDKADTDGDTLLDGAEVKTHDTDPRVADTDADGLRDDAEIARGTQARVADTDEDGLKDGAEVDEHGTDPLQADTDEDTLLDGDEVERKTNPLSKDTDSDGLDDADEVKRSTNPLVKDSDEDGLDDGDEVKRGTDPLNADTDEDALLDGDEVKRGTDPLSKDTDSDGLDDADEMQRGTDPVKTDTDRDGLSDGDEVSGVRNTRWSSAPTNPLAGDSDRDGLLDGSEIKGVKVAGRLVRPNPNSAHSDSDRIKDGVEVKGYKTRTGKVFRSNPVSADSDRDGIRDLIEVLGLRNWRFAKRPTNPLAADTDRDGFRDLREVQRRTNPADKSSFPGSRRR
ncbi:hypothetical protein GCM10027425_04250 [Alteromonas gracilis]